MGDPSPESTVSSCSVPVQLPARLARGSRTLRRNPHNILRISTASSPRGTPTLSFSKSASTASSIWYSSSHVDLMLMSRKRPNSFELEAPHPSTMLNTIDSADVTICFFSEPLSLRGKARTARRTPRARSCDLRQTFKPRKSCTSVVSRAQRTSRRPFPPRTIDLFFVCSPAACEQALATTTDQLPTHYLDPLSISSSSQRTNSLRPL
jgi:hypothetical protein